jgi:hypothetical protein
MGEARLKKTAAAAVLKKFDWIPVLFTTVRQCTGRATRPVLTVSDCVYTQQQPIVRRRTLSENLKVL